MYFGASLKPKLRDGYVFGEEVTFEVEVSKVAPPSNPCTNHRVLNEFNALRIFELMQLSSTTRSQISHMILRPISFATSDGIEVVFPGHEEKSLFYDLYDAYMIKNGDNDEVRQAFLKCFTWEPIDGQHIFAACTEIAPNMTNSEEYQQSFSRWPAQVVVYDDPQFYMELSRQVCTILIIYQKLEDGRVQYRMNSLCTFECINNVILENSAINCYEIMYLTPKGVVNPNEIMDVMKCLFLFIYLPILCK